MASFGKRPGSRGPLPPPLVSNSPSSTHGKPATVRSRRSSAFVSGRKSEGPLAVLLRSAASSPTRSNVSVNTLGSGPLRSLIAPSLSVSGRAALPSSFVSARMPFGSGSWERSSVVLIVLRSPSDSHSSSTLRSGSLIGPFSTPSFCRPVDSPSRSKRNER
jgi:hypothetical protein